ncbi:MAG: hypothetical protein WC565_05835 [Parcubacteria group bacterium]
MMWVSRVKMEDVEQRMVRAEKRLTMLECQHRWGFEFKVDNEFTWFNYVKKCKSCGKVVESYSDPDAWDIARIAYEEAELAAQKKALLARQPRGKKK